MEMNFPHKDTASDSETTLSNERSEQSSYAALMAHVIARQSSSYSARKIFAHDLVTTRLTTSGKGRSLLSSIHYFSGHVAEEQTTNNANLSIRGHFRPDLADQKIIEEDAQ